MERNLERNSIQAFSSPSEWLAVETETSGLEVLLLHEDLPTGLRAKEALNNLEEQFEIKTCFHISLFRFGMLADAELAGPALQQAKQADILLLSLHGDRQLPAAVRIWLLRWLESRDFKPCALVVSLDSNIQDSLQSNSTLNFLRDITAPLEVDLFLHLGSSPFMAGDRIMAVNRHIPVGTSWI
jgi:hypothetical protein